MVGDAGMSALEVFYLAFVAAIGWSLGRLTYDFLKFLVVRKLPKR